MRRIGLAEGFENAWWRPISLSPAPIGGHGGLDLAQHVLGSYLARTSIPDE
jgi:hypothetical protein